MYNVLTSKNEWLPVHKRSSIIFSFWICSRSVWATMMEECNAAVWQLFFFSLNCQEIPEKSYYLNLPAGSFCRVNIFFLVLEIHFRTDHCYNFLKYSCWIVSNCDFLFWLTNTAYMPRWKDKEIWNCRIIGKENKMKRNLFNSRRWFQLLPAITKTITFLVGVTFVQVDWALFIVLEGC